MGTNPPDHSPCGNCEGPAGGAETQPRKACTPSSASLLSSSGTPTCAYHPRAHKVGGRNLRFNTRQHSAYLTPGRSHNQHVKQSVLRHFQVSVSPFTLLPQSPRKKEYRFYCTFFFLTQRPSLFILKAVKETISLYHTDKHL